MRNVAEHVVVLWLLWREMRRGVKESKREFREREAWIDGIPLDEHIRNGW